jgi:uncharacterized membrane protein YkvA (DUF1232 family)
MDKFKRVIALLSDPRTPKLPRIAVVLGVLYLLSPVDLVPDFLVPVVGYLDDITLLWLALRWMIRAAPRPGIDEAPAGLAKP